MDFSNREIATGILIAVGLILLVAFPKTRPVFFKGLIDVFKALFQWKLLLPIGGSSDIWWGHGVSPPAARSMRSR